MAEVDISAEVVPKDLARTFGVDPQLLTLAAVNEILHSYHVYLKTILTEYRNGDMSIAQAKKHSAYVSVRMYNLVDLWLENLATMRKEELF